MITLLIMAIGVIMLFLAVCVFSLGVFPILLILGFIFMFLFNVKFALLTICFGIIYKIISKIFKK